VSEWSHGGVKGAPERDKCAVQSLDWRISVAVRRSSSAFNVGNNNATCTFAAIDFFREKILIFFSNKKIIFFEKVEQEKVLI
jgi:hypothetical protein